MSSECKTSAVAEPELTRPILLWAPPRSASTAFERAVMEHPGASVFHEMLADCFYFGADRRKTNGPAQAAIEASLLKRDTTYLEQLQEVLDSSSADGRRFSFSKELSIYYQVRKLPTALMARFRHSFLIRSPEKVARSFLRFAAKEGAANGEACDSTYFDPDELGFVELAELDRVVTTELQQQPVIVDADDLLAAPEATLRAWCTALGISFDQRMLSWDAYEPASWKKWPGWHVDAIRSTGFAAPVRKAEKQAVPKPLPDEVRHIVEQCQPIYDKLYARRIMPMVVAAIPPTDALPVLPPAPATGIA